MKFKTAENYRQRLTRVIDYMYQHLDRDLDVNTLADVAAMSPYHFHRIYRQVAQEPINTTVRRMRLQFAAAELLRTDSDLAVIANQVSYGSAEAFARAFKKYFGQSPSEFRTTHGNDQAFDPSKVPMLPNGPKTYLNPYGVELATEPSFWLLGYDHQGSYESIGQSFEKIFQYAKTHNLWRAETRSFGLYFDDPLSVPDEDLRSVACMTIDQSLISQFPIGSVINEKPFTEQSNSEPPKSEPGLIEVPGGRRVHLTYRGPYPTLETPYNWLFGAWIPQSEFEPKNFPPLEEYLNDPKTTPQQDLLTRITCLLND